MRVTFIVTLLLLVFYASSSSAAGRARTVVYTSECSCDNDHGVARWRAKTDPSDPPPNAAEIHPVVPSDIFAWQGPGIIPHGGGRTGNELRWFALTGRVISMGAESDGDLHLVLIDANDPKPGKVIVEMPLGARWCGMRTTAFSWTNAVFPFTADWQHSPFHIARRPVITVIGKAFYDTDHSGKNIRNNRRPREKDKAVWEIHPVMKMQVVDPGDAAPAEPAVSTEVDEEAEPAATAAATPAPPQLVTITQPLRIKVPYGESVIPAGMKLELIDHDAAFVRVRYLGQIQIVPISATDLH